MNLRSARVDPQILAFARDMRRKPASAEQMLWYRLRDRRLNGLKFRRQVAIGKYIADFYCASRKLIIELDGDSHATRQDYDNQRSEFLNDAGYAVIRFTNTEIRQHLGAVLLAILNNCPSNNPL